MVSLPMNSVVSPGVDSKILSIAVRILGAIGNNVVVIELSMKPAKPWLIESASLMDEIRCGAAVVNSEQPLEFLIRDESEIGEKEKQSRERSWNLIRELVEGKSPIEILTPSFGADIKRHAEKVQVDRKQIYRLLYRYWSMGQIKNAFLWNTTNCGGRGKPRKYTSGKILGRPPKYLGVVLEDRAISLTETHFSSIRLAYDRFASGKCGTIRDAWNWMLMVFYTKVMPDGTKGDVDRGKHPTFCQFAYHGRKFFDSLYVLKGRRGGVRWNKDYRPITGSASDGLSGPCQRFEIDSTIADIYLVHRINRNWLIGRPVIYVVVDAYSRMIVGLHVGLEGPSWNGARHALFNAYTNKVDFCRRYNVEIQDDEWPCHHLPIELSADRAELLSEAGEAMSNSLGTILKIAPPYRPDWKSIVESRFRLINEGLDLKFVPGGVDARRMERGDRDYELDAILDIDQFTEMVILGVLQHNKHLRLPHLLTPNMIAESLEPTPINIWNWSMSHNLVNAKTVSPSELKIALLPSKEVRITRSGVLFQGVLYTCEIAQREQWFAKSHNGATRYVRVWYDPNCIDNCWVKIGPDFTPLVMVPYQAKTYHGYRLEEVQDIIQITNQVSPDAQYAATNDTVALKSRQDAIVREASGMQKNAVAPASKSDFKSGKREKRQAELAVERKNDVDELSKLHIAHRTQDSAVIPSSSLPVTSSSSRSAAFLKLVIDESRGKTNEQS